MFRVLPVLIVVLFVCSCQQLPENYSVAREYKTVPEKKLRAKERTFPSDYVYLQGLELLPKRIKKINGDFNGDGKTEWLSEYYFNDSTGERISEIPIEGSWTWMKYNQPVTYLIASDTGITPLAIGDYNWGVLSLLNLGDINADSLDEIAVVRDNEDYSSVSACRIYHYCGGTWKLVFDFDIHEEAFWYEDGFDTTVYHRKIPGYLEKHRGEWRYFSNSGGWTDDRMMDDKGPVLIPLAPDLKKKCPCRPD